MVSLTLAQAAKLVPKARFFHPHTSYPISIITRHVSVFHGFVANETNGVVSKPAWHSPLFMSGNTIAEKEAWLENLLSSSNASAGAKQNQSELPTVDVEAFLVVLRALASNQAVDDAGAPRRADIWMNRLLETPENIEKTCAKNLQPTRECYQYIIQAWANSNKEQAIVVRNRMERWLNELVGSNSSQTRKSCGKLEPSIECFNAYLDGLSRGRLGKSKRDREILKENAKKGEALLRRLHSTYFHLCNDTKHGNDEDDPHSNGIIRKESAVRPNTDTFNFVIRGWTRCKHESDVHERVLTILRLMESYQRENPVSYIDDHDAPRPNTKSYSMAMDALVSEAKRKARHYYNRQKRRRSSVEKGHDEPFERNSLNGIDEMNEAESILKYMHDLHDAGVVGVTPNRVSYNILINGWAALASYSRRGDEFKAEEILHTMISHRENRFWEASPDVVSYEKVMLAWANSGHPNAGRRAQWWLKQLWKDYDLHAKSTSESKHQSTLLPTVNTYNVVMKALAYTDGALAAENILLDLGEKYRNDSEHFGLCPNSESFAIVIRAWLQSAKTARNIDERLSSIRRAYEWLCSLRGIENENNLSTAPELFTGILAVSRTCAAQRPDVLELGMEVFEDFRQSRHRLDCISYATLLQVGLQAHSTQNCGNERAKFVDKIFAECCDDGLVSNVFVRAIVDDPSIECKSIADRFLQDFPLPSSWSRNVKNKNNHCSSIDILSPTQRHQVRKTSGKT